MMKVIHNQGLESNSLWRSGGYLRQNNKKVHFSRVPSGTRGK